MAVCNVKVKYIRPKYDNLKEWCEDSNNVYIGRKGIVFINSERYPKQDSVWANPFKVNSNTTREDVIHKYKLYIINRLNNDKNLRDQLLLLKGKNLGCWCYPDMCHGQVLLKLIEQYVIHIEA